MCETSAKISKQKKMIEENQQMGIKNMDENENQFTGLGDNLEQIADRAKWEIFKGKNGNWYFHLRANNYEIVCSSEGYTTKENALKGIEAIRKNAAAKIYQLVKVG